MTLDLSPGWYRLAPAASLAAGETRTLDRLGEQLLLFRDAAGRPRLIEPWCPHLGAHLGHGGRVEGERLVCPFHGWRIHGDGHVADVPYSDHAPPRVCLRTWRVETWADQLMARVGRAAAGALPVLETEGWGAFEVLRSTIGERGALPGLGRALLPAGEIRTAGPGRLLLHGELGGVIAELLLLETPLDTDRAEQLLLLRTRRQGRWLGDWQDRRRARAAVARR